MAREAMDVCLRLLKESNKSRFDSYSVRNSVLIISHIILSFGITPCTFFPTAFLEIAVRERIEIQKSKSSCSSKLIFHSLQYFCIYLFYLSIFSCIYFFIYSLIYLFASVDCKPYFFTIMQLSSSLLIPRR